VGLGFAVVLVVVRDQVERGEGFRLDPIGEVREQREGVAQRLRRRDPGLAADEVPAEGAVAIRRSPARCSTSFSASTESADERQNSGRTASVLIPHHRNGNTPQTTFGAALDRTRPICPASLDL
jgi:hypothetical protein